MAKSMQWGATCSRSDRPSGQNEQQMASGNAAPWKARDLMQIGVKTVPCDASIYEAIRILVERRISGLPVVDGATMVGIITEKDILQLVFRQEHLPGAVGKYMTAGVVAFDEEEEISKIWACLVSNSYRRVPIVHGGKLTGIISRTDLIRARISDLASRASGQTPALSAQGPFVRDVMTPGLLTATPDMPVSEAAKILLANEITGLPVVDDSLRLLGILSEKDVLKRLGDEHAHACSVQEVMTSDVISFQTNDSFFNVCECLANKSFRRVPVLDRGRLVGIVSRADLIVYILKNRSILFQGRPLLVRAPDGG
ncbi:MAG: CBS domain-containing protein [Sedimentisphaerales bacterium]|nr:CBS domain-containing protein [Sedimentisphaerales bacterium]